jgi:hypothetical protein
MMGVQTPEVDAKLEPVNVGPWNFCVLIGL